MLWNYALGPYGYSSEVYDAQYYDQEPVIETRKIIQAINQELFTNELLIYRNELLILMFKYIYSEFTTPDWLIKTSFIDVDHKLRNLRPYQLYQKDNQTFVEQYLQEVKPFHVQTLAFNLIYDGLDPFLGALTDFDVPAYWNTDLEIPQFVSPVLTPYTDSLSYGESFISDAEPNAAIWTETPWQSWFNNYTLSITDATILNGGSGYVTAPAVLFGTPWEADTVYTTGQQIYYINGSTNSLYTVTAAGTSGATPPPFTSGSGLNGTATLTYAGTGAAGVATIDEFGEVVDIAMTDPGSGYLTTSTITFVSTSGSGAQAVPIMTNSLVRNFAITIRFDRYQYASTIYEWQAKYSYADGDQVRWRNSVWSANDAVSSATFNVDQWTAVPAETLSGVDRTMGFYTPTPNMFGLSLPLLINGIHYPGVQVMAPTFDQDSGFDVGSYSFNPYDNLVYGPEGRPTYDPGILDAAYSSSYLDSYLGLRAEDINVDGGKYIDLYSSHAPEELIPGSEFDTMDFRIYNDYSDARSQYQNTTQYVTGDRVGYLGLVYQAKQNTIGNLPTNTTYWGQVIPLDSRIFQDMRGLQLAYTITDATTTELLEIDNTNDIIYVVDASALTEPDLDTNQWGALTIGAERIMYRERDLVANTVSGLIRGTAGTAITTHLIGDVVYSMGKNNLFGQQYQNYVVQTNTVSDGSTAVFDAPNITLSTSTTAWVIGNTYSTGAIVINSGSFYSAKQAVPAGTAIANTTYWQM